MHPADKAVLRLAAGMALAVLIAYGLALGAPFVLCVMTVFMLCKPGPPIPLMKGVVLACIVALLLVAGVLMVPLLKHSAAAGVLLTAVLLYAVYFMGARKANPLATILVIAFAVMPVVGVADQALVTELSVAIALGLGIGILVNNVSHALFPDAPRPAGHAAPPAVASREAARQAALQGTLVLLPVFMLALTNPALYVAAIIKTGALGQQASSIRAQSAGRELVGSTLMGAAIALVVWCGLSVWPSLWMLMLWIVAAAFWVGVRLYRIKASASPPSFWLNALVTMFILLGPAIEDANVGKDVLRASATRATLFVLVSLYAWAVVWAFQRWKAFRSAA